MKPLATRRSVAIYRAFIPRSTPAAAASNISSMPIFGTRSDMALLPIVLGRVSIRIRAYTLSENARQKVCLMTHDAPSRILAEWLRSTRPSRQSLQKIATNGSRPESSISPSVSFSWRLKATA